MMPDVVNWLNSRLVKYQVAEPLVLPKMKFVDKK
jgi:hypothetical protein